jgi:hypothetical protein
MAEHDYGKVSVFAQDRLATRSPGSSTRGTNGVAVQAPRHMRLSVEAAGAILVAGMVINPGRGRVPI